jgi:hypothetical protein
VQHQAHPHETRVQRCKDSHGDGALRESLAREIPFEPRRCVYGRALRQHVLTSLLWG